MSKLHKWASCSRRSGRRGPLLVGRLVGRDVMFSVDRGPLPPGSDGAVVRRIGPGEGRAKPIPFLSGRVRSAGCGPVFSTNVISPKRLIQIAYFQRHWNNNSSGYLGIKFH
ncbi:unnamed protein product [Microthlaspi erraticum]|uniref:Uncharacterized protein n=1 Tax=Microthlaspi erraticum TaxID=1685480 RepID=A0A6D2HXG4_9BRAS|nr:unnamed protein product [Microthlaspi erraticum]